MIRIGDMDPAYGALEYVSNRFELNIEQRFWLAFLYSTCYSGATTFYLYNEFPDFEQISLKRINLWWNANKHKTLFQSDRRWIKSRNEFPQMVKSYRETVKSMAPSQYLFYQKLKGTTNSQWYQNAYQAASGIYGMGRFGLFIYLEAVARIGQINMEPRGLDLKNSESSRNGLCYALGLNQMITGKETGRAKLSDKEIKYLDTQFKVLESKVKKADSSGLSNVWNIETSLCAFKKYMRTLVYPDTPKNHRRYLGYYLDRQADEISVMQQNVDKGVCWDVLWQYRQESLDKTYLKEFKK